MTKFRAPAAGAWTLARPGLRARFDDHTGVIVVRAPAGYGKTTAMAEWVAVAAHRRAIWVSIDDDDDDLAGLWAAIRAAAQRAGLEADSRGTGTPRADTIIPLLDAFSADGRPWILVLDDIHLVTREEAVASLDWFIARCPENLTIALGTRVAMDLPGVERLRARGRVLDLGPGQLALTGPQTAEALGRAIGLSAAESDVVYAATGGWPAAVSLVQMALSRGLSAERIRAGRVADLDGIRALVAEGLAVGDAHDAELLRQISVLERFDARILAAVVQDERAWPLAMQIAERTGLIATVGDSERWWRMHSLVRDILHSQLDRADPALRRELHRRAFHAFEAENDLSATIHHLLDAEDYDTVADILANVRATSMVPRQAVGLSWLERIPEAALDRDPRLAFWEAWAAATTGDPVRRDRALARGRLAAAVGPIDAFRSWDDVEDFVRASASYEDVGGAHRAAERFLMRYDAGHPLAEIVTLRLATMLYLEGQCEEALRILDRLDRGSPLTRPLRLLVPAYRALCELEGDDVAAAQADAGRCDAARRAYRLGNDLPYLPADQALARLQTTRGDPAAGLETALAALEVARGCGDPVLVVPHLLLEVARAQFALGHEQKAFVAVNRAGELCRAATDPGALPARIAVMRADLGMPPAVSPHETLTRRELDVLPLLATAMTAPEIASELFVSVNTVRTHIKSIHRKFGATSRSRAIAAARTAGLLVPDPVNSPR